MLNKKGAAKKTSLKNELGFSYLIAAFVFLANPCINVVDILPDFFGYVFLMKGLSKWSDLCPNIADAMAGIGRLRWFMLLKMLSMVLVPYVDSTYVLIFVFAFGIIELMYALPASARIFDGLEYFGTRFDCKPIFKRYKDARLLTGLFFVVKTAFCLFPELCALSTFEYSGLVTGGVQTDPAYYRNFLVILNLIVSSVVGIIWLINLITYTARITKDKPFLERVLHDYTLEIGSNKGIFIRRRLRACISTIIVGLIFLPNMWLDGVNFVPTFVCAIFIICAMALLGRISKISKWSIILPLIFAVVSIASFSLSLYFGTYFRIGDVYRNLDAYFMFNVTRVLATLEYIAMTASIYMVCRELKKLVRLHLAAAPEVTDKRIIEYSNDTQRQLNNSITAGFITFVVAALINLTYLTLRADIIADVWLAAFLATGVWIFCMASIMNRVYTQIEYKYI